MSDADGRQRGGVDAWAPVMRPVIQGAVPIDRAVVISRADRPERLAAFTQRWRASFLGHMDPHVFPAIVSEGGTRGCLESHLAVLGAAAADDPEANVLILEDDACFTETFPFPTHAPPEWDVLWLGGQHVAPPSPSRAPGGIIRTGWVRPVELMRTHAYLVRQPGHVLELLRAARPPRIDPYLARLPLNHFVVEPQTAGQVAGPSDTGGVPLERDSYWHLRRAPWR